MLCLILLLLVWPAQAQPAPLTVENAAALTISGTAGYGPATDIAYAPDGTQVAVATLNGVWLFDRQFENPRWLRRVGGTNAIAWKPGGAQIAGANLDGTVTLWDVFTGSVVVEIDAHANTLGDFDLTAFLAGAARYGATDVAFSPDGTQLVTGGADGLVKVFESVDGAFFLTFEGHNGPVEAVAWSPNGEIASTDSTQVLFWSTMSGTGSPLGAYTHLVRWSYNGRFIATRQGESLVILDAATQTPMQTLSMGLTDPASPLVVVWSPVDDRIAYRTADSGFVVFNPVTGETPATISPARPFTLMTAAWSPDGTRLGGIYEASGALVEWNITAQGIVQAYDTFGWGGRDLAWTPDGTALYTLNAFEMLHAWDPTTNAAGGGFLRPDPTASHQPEDDLQHLVVAPDGTLYALTPDHLLTISPVSFEVTNRLDLATNDPRDAALNPSGTRLLVLADDPATDLVAPSLVDLTTGTSNPLEVAGDFVTARWLNDETVLLLDATTGISAIDVTTSTLRFSLPNPDGNDRSGDLLAVTADGARFAWMQSGIQVAIYNGADGTLQVETPVIYQGGDGAMAFSPNGALLAAGVRFSDAVGQVRQRVIVWNTATLTQLAELSGHQTPVVALGFRPDGATLASLDALGVGYLWSVP